MCEYKQAKNEINSLLEIANQNYCSNLFNNSSKSKKDFGHASKSKGKYNTGTVPLKDGDTIYTTTEQKSCALNK